MFTLSYLLFTLGVLNFKGASETQGKVSLSDAPTEVSDYNGSLYATCEMKPSTTLPLGQPQIYGQVLFKQVYPAGRMQIIVNLRGFPTRESERAIHIHQFGDLSKGCSAAGPHFNPLGQNHANHPGDLGNFGSSRGRVRVSVTAKATLFGTESVLGRSVVLHERKDDMGKGGDEESLRSGNAGQRIACCVIGVSSSSLWENTAESSWEDSAEE
ncbi:extracellular superoxide dismutase [Cu-Zn] [Centroberyx affinis]|uniref:extracellular superoxide dismutase [Cu-Zn] n=1 Tax=Centroberyx affinis TaxID=166261 RepID=UPI003A5C17A6